MRIEITKAESEHSSAYVMPSHVCAIVVGTDNSLRGQQKHTITIHLTGGQSLVYKYADHTVMYSAYQQLAKAISNNENTTL